MIFLQIASVFAAENRFTHAAYYCEQAVSLAKKCEKRSVQMKLNYELALYYQHSTSEKVGKIHVSDFVEKSMNFEPRDKKSRILSSDGQFLKF